MKTTSHRQRLTPRNMIMDLHSRLHTFRAQLTLIHRANENGELKITNGKNDVGNPVKHLRNSYRYRELGIEELALNLQLDITPLLLIYELFVDDYFDGFRVGDACDLSNEDCTVFELIARMAPTLIKNNLVEIEQNVLNGDYLRIYHRLDDALHYPRSFTEEIKFRAYQRSFDMIARRYTPYHTTPIEMKLLSRLLSQARPLTIRSDSADSSRWLCPVCHVEISMNRHNFCHHCGQKLKVSNRLF